MMRTSSITRPRRRAIGFLVAGIAIVALLTCAAANQAIMSARDAARLEAPGELIDIGTHRMHLNCIGSGTPTVILDHASASLSSQWALVQSQLARETRTCAYDRSGYGWSQSGPGPYDAGRQAEELAMLLDAAGESEPVLHVGHSSGALVGSVLAASHPDRVVGLVMVEPGYSWGTPGVDVETDRMIRAQEEQVAGANLALMRSGIGRLIAPLVTADTDLPGPEKERFDALTLATRQFETFHDEIKGGEATADAVLESRRQLHDMPLVVLSAQHDPDDPVAAAIARSHRELAATSTRGSNTVVPHTDHMGIVLNEEPAQLVTERILQLLDQVRRSPTSAPAQ